MKETIAKFKKKWIATGIAIVVLGLCATGGYVGMGYYYAKQNESYTEQQIREIATKQTAGEIIGVHKQFELEDDRLSQSEFEYELEIKTADNQLNIVDVSSRTGTIEIDRDHD